MGDPAATLELGRSAIHSLQWGGDRLRLGIVLYMIAGAIAATQPEPAAIILGAAETNMVQSSVFAPMIDPIVKAELGEERARELRARGADMDWDQTIAYTLTQTTQARSELESATQPDR